MTSLRRQPRFLFLGILTVSWVLAACQQQKQLDEMHDSTVEMNDTTKQLRDTTIEMKQTTVKLEKNTGDMKTVTDDLAKQTAEMNKTTTEMNGTTQQMGKVTAELYDASRQGAALEIRRKSLEMLYAAESNGKKVAEAGKYFMSFEFQLWTGYGQDLTEEKRDHLLADAAAEFFKDIKEFTVEEAPWFNPFAKAKGNGGLHDRVNKEASFNAIAAALHRVNRKQDEMLVEHKDLKSLSMYEMLKRSLQLERGLNDGTVAYADLKGYQREVLNNRDVALRLLQARHNFIATIFLNEVLPQEGAKATINNALNYYLGAGKGWTMEIDKYNVSQLKTLNQYLTASLGTRQVLRDLGQTVEVDPTLAAFLKGLTLKASKGEGGGEINAARIELIGQIREIQK